ncbi:MAG: hypothetical protein PHX18_00720 [Candidatus Gastranaerophilales bacterium]|nr:hypothetical protein [Candidatus Gastranaerophilales bacterium]
MKNVLRLFIFILCSACLMSHAHASMGVLSNNTNESVKLLKLQVEQAQEQRTSEEKEPEADVTQDVVQVDKLREAHYKELNEAVKKASVQKTSASAGVTFWQFIKGVPMDDGIIIGMWSYHTEPGGHDKYTETNNLIGLQVKGVFATTFVNSWGDRSYFFGVSRKFWEKQYKYGFKLNGQYKAGLMYGYYDRYPNIANFSPFIFPVLGVNYKNIAVDLSMIPSNYPIFVAMCRIDAPKFKKNTKKAPAELNNVNNINTPQNTDGVDVDIKKSPDNKTGEEVSSN